MSTLQARKVLEKFGDGCIDCGICQSGCSALAESSWTVEEIAHQVLDGSVENEVLEIIKRCDLCGLCGQGCLVNLKPSDMMAAAREILVANGQIDLDDYQVMLVDLDWNYFTIYRDTFGIKYDDLQRERYDILYFPGCTLSSYSPELTRATYQWLSQQGMQLGFTDLCCGKPLASIGLRERKDRLLALIHEQMVAAGAHRMVTACPNCFHQMAGQLGSIEVISLYDLLKQSDLHLAGDQRLTVHDSCPDRYGLAVGEDIRSLLSGYSLLEMEHHGKNTICCGSGGIVSMIDPELCTFRAQERLKEFDDTGADICITACMACAHRLSRSADSGHVMHLLELVFGIPVDYSHVQANTTAMWEGEWGTYNQYRLSQAKLITSPEGGLHV
jgi:fumarate reductase (CoM/CoB) subunit B